MKQESLARPWVEKYGDRGTIDDVIETLRLEIHKDKVAAFLEQWNISRDKNGRLRLIPKGGEVALGMWVREEHLKAFALAFIHGDRYQQERVSADMFEYMGDSERADAARSSAERLKQIEKELMSIAAASWTRVMASLVFGLAVAEFGHPRPRKNFSDEARPGEIEEEAESEVEIADAKSAEPVHWLESRILPKDYTYAPPPIAPAAVPHRMGENETIWGIVDDLYKKILGARYSKKALYRGAQIVCEKNNIRDAGLGVIKGEHDARRLPPGFSLDLESARKYAEGLL